VDGTAVSGPPPAPERDVKEDGQLYVLEADMFTALGNWLDERIVGVRFGKRFSS
jgi:hypothetical protein